MSPASSVMFPNSPAGSPSHPLSCGRCLPRSLPVHTETFWGGKAQSSLRQHLPGASRHLSGFSRNKSARREVWERREAPHSLSPAEGGVSSLCALPGWNSLAFPGCLAFPGWHSQQCQGAGEGSTSPSTKSNLLNLFKLLFSFRSSPPHPLAGQTVQPGAHGSPGCAGFQLFPEPGRTGFGSFSFPCSQKCLCHQPLGLCRGGRGEDSLQHLPRRAWLCSCRGCSRCPGAKNAFYYSVKKARLRLAALIMHK